MTVAVLTTTTTTTTRTTHREPLRVIDMATSQARPASSSAQSNGEKRRGRRPSGLLDAKENGGDENTVSQKSTRSATKRNAAVYDEDDQGFKFTRATATKKPKIGSGNASTNETTADQASQPRSRKGRPPKAQAAKAPSASGQEEVAANTTNGGPQRGRPRRSSLEVEAQTGKRTTRNRNEEPPLPSQTPTKRRGRPSKSETTGDANLQSPEPAQGGTTRIALPMADTPVIRRNREMREERGRTQRRSSLGMRGRRASSLIDSGASNAIPHREVATAEFYKHIASDLLETRRMKQLLTWCATRAMEQRPSQSSSVDDQAQPSARLIQSQLVEDFANKSELSNWFEREQASAPTVVVKKPNPKNIQNAEKIKELESQIHRLQSEKQALKALLRPPSISKLDSTTFEDTPEDVSSQSTPHIDTAALDPQQQSIITSIGLDNLRRDNNNKKDKTSQSSITNPLPPATVSNRLSHITSSLAPTLDAFASGLHDIDIYRSAADRLSSQVLRICSQRLEERDIRNAARMREIEGGSDQDDKGGGEDSSKDSLRTRQTRRHREDIGVILGALSRVERR